MKQNEDSKGFRELGAELEIDNKKVENNSIFKISKKSIKFQHSITKIKSRDYRLINIVKSILFADSVNSDSVKLMKQKKNAYQ